MAGEDTAEGTPFGRYRLVSLLGEGGMGEVWRAHDTVTDRVVAIKVLPPKLSKDEDFQQRFRREAHTAARLNTPHVVPIYDYGEIDGRLFVSMRLIEGRDLAAVLADGPLEPARAVRIVDQVARALHAAHKVGLIHRDIKPSNILLDEDDFAYLIDFGIARIADDTRLTKTGNTIGTFAYIAPERLGGRGDEDARVDIYSLACVLYECLAGEPPFGGDTMARLVAAHLSTPPPRPSINQPNVPPPVDEVIATGMAKDPEQRYATTIELADAAGNALTTPLSGTTPHPVLNANQPPPLLTAARVWQQPAEPTQSATQQHPPQWPPRQFSTPPPPWGQPARAARGDRNRWLALGVAGLVVVAALTGAGIYMASKNSNPVATTATTSTTTAPTTTTPTGPPPVAASALDGLLLSPDQINTAMGTTGMVVTKNEPGLIHDDRATVPDTACLPVYDAVEIGVYPNEWHVPVRGQYLNDPERTLWQGSAHWDNSTVHAVQQNVVLLPSAHDAEAFFTGSAPQLWQACSNRQFHVTVTGATDQVWAVGQILNANGTMSVTMTVVNTPSNGGKKAWQSCTRALTVANNVAIDIRACTFNESDAQPSSAINIAHQIADKVPTT